MVIMGKRKKILMVAGCYGMLQFMKAARVFAKFTMLKVLWMLSPS
jgi:hypothetical protein